MVNHPPAFSSQKEEQDKWNEGFSAGVKEVLAEMENSIEVVEDKDAVLDSVKTKMKKYL